MKGSVIATLLTRLRITRLRITVLRRLLKRCSECWGLHWSMGWMQGRQHGHGLLQSLMWQRPLLRLLCLRRIQAEEVLKLLLRQLRLRRTRVAALHAILTLRIVVMIGHVRPNQHANAYDTRKSRRSRIFTPLALSGVLCRSALAAAERLHRRHVWLESGFGLRIRSQGRIQ